MSETEFIKVTNRDIYQEIVEIKETLNSMKRRVSMAYWISSTSLSLSLLIVGFMLSKT